MSTPTPTLRSVAGATVQGIRSTAGGLLGALSLSSQPSSFESVSAASLIPMGIADLVVLAACRRLDGAEDRTVADHRLSIADAIAGRCQGAAVQ